MGIQVAGSMYRPLATRFLLLRDISFLFCPVHSYAQVKDGVSCRR
jgi:hypothetical protein